MTARVGRTIRVTCQGDGRHIRGRVIYPRWHHTDHGSWVLFGCEFCQIAYSARSIRWAKIELELVRLGVAEIELGDIAGVRQR